jgi:hypothetical protein
MFVADSDIIAGAKSKSLHASQCSLQPQIISRAIG